MSLFSPLTGFQEMSAITCGILKLARSKIIKVGLSTNVKSIKTWLKKRNSSSDANLHTVTLVSGSCCYLQGRLRKIQTLLHKSNRLFWYNITLKKKMSHHLWSPMKIKINKSDLGFFLGFNVSHVKPLYYVNIFVYTFTLNSIRKFEKLFMSSHDMTSNYVETTA